jgi:serine/threonine protein kinase
MGIVYKAIDPDIEREVAIKTMRFDTLIEGMEKEELLGRVTREAKAAGRLNHPNIITIYDVVRDKDLTYIVMQYVDGQSLQALIDSGRILAPHEIIDLLKPISDALDYAHQNGIIHRDIKPANILIEKSGQPHLADFGVARIEKSTMTQAGTTVGTLSYMSPEQVKGETIDHRSDIFALGVILYELLTGKRPFAGDNLSTIVYKIVHEAPQRMGEIKKDLPRGYEAVIQKALAKNREDRYQSCREMIADLEYPERMAEATIAFEFRRDRSSKVGGRRKTRLAVAGTALLTAVAVGAYFFIYAPRLKKPVNGTQETQSSKKEGVSPLGQSAGASASSNPSAESADPGIAELKDAFAAGQYEETVKLAEEILRRSPSDQTAKDHLKKAGAAILSSRVSPLLQSGIAGYNSGNYAQCVRDMEMVLKLDRDNKEAQTWLFRADEAVANTEIRQVLESFRVAIENKDLPTILSHIGSPTLAGEQQADYQLMFDGYHDIIYRISNISIKYLGRWNATASFSYIRRAVYNKDGIPKSEEGTRTWQLKKQGSAWKITGLS